MYIYCAALQLKVQYLRNTMQNSSLRKYHCYNCAEYFQDTHEKEACKFCNSQAIEEIYNNNSSNNNGQPFAVYQIPAETLQTNRVTSQVQNRQTSAISPFSIMERLSGSGLSNLVTSLAISGPFVSLGFGGNNNPLQHFNFGGQFLNLLRGLGSGQSNVTRATSEQISRLESINNVKECSICQEGQQSEHHQQPNEQKSGYKLPCNHQFHKSCIAPWFEQTNTCPSCRKALG